MKIPELGSLQMTRTVESHYGHQKLLDTAEAGKILNIENAAETGVEKTRVSFENYLIDAVKTYATLGEICGVLREVFGEYQ